MCGILAYLLNNADNRKSQLKSIPRRMLQDKLYKQMGRGPDNMKLEQVGKDLVFGFNRLRINDLSEAADQPLKKGAVSVICNGEIYNHEKLIEKYGFKSVS
jgi:asparagine synthetase B (glutamine-hydrolysing)